MRQPRQSLILGEKVMPIKADQVFSNAMARICTEVFISKSTTFFDPDVRFCGSESTSTAII
jgi:hypothetical protein